MKTTTVRREASNRGSTLAAAASIAVVALMTGVSATTTLGVSAVDLPIPAEIQGIIDLTDARTTFANPLPEDPKAALAEEVAEFLAAIGFPTELAAEVFSAPLSDEAAGRLAVLLGAMNVCNAATLGTVETVGLETMVAALRAGDVSGLDTARFQPVVECVPAVLVALGDLELTIAQDGILGGTQTNSANLLDIWPVITVDNAGDDVYLNDYALQVDVDGNDVYNNNVGSNMIDLRFAPSTSPVPGVALSPLGDGRAGFGPSEGCAVALNSLQQGNCTPLVAVLLDTSGSDTYGLFESPVADIDARCTRDEVVRRMVTIGQGFSGLGVQIDTTGNDVYNGKTGAIGSGHIFGTGILVDRAGNDESTAVRNAQGFSLIGNLGLFRDEGGDDTYDFYMPRPLDPKAANEEEGGGGVIDDTNACDRLPRFSQGGGDAVGFGILIDDDGSDSYTAGCTQDFLAPGDIGAPACGQGFGATAGVGILIDRGDDRDRYRGVPDRANEVTFVQVTENVSVDPVGPTVTREVSVEIFSDS